MAQELDLAKNIAQRYCNELKNNIKISSIYLFGSYVDNRADKHSDIDIAVISEDFTGDPVDDMLYLMKISKNIDLRIEPHPFLTDKFDSSYPLAREIINKGIKII